MELGLNVMECMITYQMIKVKVFIGWLIGTCCMLC